MLQLFLDSLRLEICVAVLHLPAALVLLAPWMLIPLK